MGAKKLCTDAEMALHHAGGFSRDSSDDSVVCFLVPDTE